MKITGSVQMKSIPARERAFLRQLESRMNIQESADQGVAVFFQKKPGEVAFIRDFILPSTLNLVFEREAPESLLRGGIVTMVRWNEYILAVPDERYRVFKPIPAGIVKATEGNNFLLTVVRELIEELFVVSLESVDPNHVAHREKRFIPPGFDQEIPGYNEILMVQAREICQVGTLTNLGLYVNPTNRALEAIYEWRLPPDLTDFTVIYQEAWFAGGKAGLPVMCLDRLGKIVGIFSGQQGFQEVSAYGLHSAIEQYFRILG